MATKTDSAAPLEEELRRLRGRVAELERALSASPTAQPAAERAAPPLATVVSHAPIVVWAVDHEGNFTLSEGVGLSGLGLRPGEVIGRNAFEMYREVPAVCEGIRQALSGREHKVDVEVAGRVFDSWYAPQYAADGRIVGATGVATDVTEHVHAERLLREAEEKWRSILEHVPDSVFTIDREGKILSINRIGPAFTRDQVIGTHVENFVVPEHRGRVRDCAGNVVSHGRIPGLRSSRRGRIRRPGVVFKPDRSDPRARRDHRRRGLRHGRYGDRRWRKTSYSGSVTSWKPASASAPRS